MLAATGSSSAGVTAMTRRVLVGSDHAAIAMRIAVAEALVLRGFEVEQIGPVEGQKSDYPDAAVAVGEQVRDGRAARGVLCCGTGIGMSIAANKVHGVRAALVHDPVTARLAAEHNAANVLCLGGRLLANVYAIDLVNTWLDTSFVARHQVRIDKITAYEQCAAEAPVPDAHA